MGSANIANQMQVPCKNGENSFIEGEKAVGRAIVIKESMAFRWLSCDSFSLAKMLSGKKRKSFFSLLGSAIFVRRDRPSGLLTLI